MADGGTEREEHDETLDQLPKCCMKMFGRSLKTKEYRVCSSRSGTFVEDKKASI